ncbi:E3 SUMO-protein ligase NSE2 isoform X4 [Pimephales promelas]|uniref:E3 SUMO-protein ligase NSE2 isoform X4 n=1 Tax=Pimephales promelas TaxID=90988 RepID=UPI0019554A71|nr:E3 SUMO-protein ligase NSE2 isoform X4 [Pimephales promelas]
MLRSLLLSPFLLKMSLSTVQSTVSTLKSCQTDIAACMDMISDVALGIVEAQGMDNSSALKKLEDMILECSRLDREINCFVDSVDEMTAQVTQEPPEAMVNLRNSVKGRFTELMAGVSDTDLQRHSKVVAFKDSVRKYAMQAGQTPDENEEEELDEDIAVTQSQTNFICPLTQVEMVNPMKNKKCNHYYDQVAVLEMIKCKHKNRKTFRCPKVGCDNKDVRESDLELDLVMKRMIQNHKRQSGKT